MKHEIDEYGEWYINVLLEIKGKTFRCNKCNSSMFSNKINDSNEWKCQGCGEYYKSK